MNFRSYFKYKNKKCKYKGRIYHSKREAGDAMWLQDLLDAGKIKEIHPQYKIPLDVNGQHIANHYVDFYIVLADNRQKFVETKGFYTEVYRLKLKLLRALYPNMDYLINPSEKQLLS
jgi:hypothetical protein